MKLAGKSQSSVDTFVPTERFRNARHFVFMSAVVDGFLGPDSAPRSGRPISVLDAGGSSIYWIERGVADDDRFRITVLNLDDAEFRKRQPHPRIAEVIGDVTKLSELYPPGSWDIVFSNSVIEHVGNLAAQRAMADGVRQVADAYFIQTPNRRFPLEPHFVEPMYLSPLCHPRMPQALRLWAAARTASGGSTPDETRQIVDSIRLMNKPELMACFPDAQLAPEKFHGLVKSWMVYRRPAAAS